ncbi:uncharacterized protein TNCV_950951 [Trichonephila clavipes]|nr:uncharacterized protein TNCV_950951 [Trichonephila clavipes]
MCNSGLDMQVFLKGKSGLAITFVLKCFACPYRVEFSSSNFHEGTPIATINTRFVYAMRVQLEKDSIQNAAKEAICENEGNKNIAVAVDGTWQKRGYTSLNGVVTVTSIDTGKVIDVDILSKYCACKNLPFHEKDCKRNYVGSSGAMEIQGASKVFQRSLSLHNARYITYLGDGDCKAFDASYYGSAIRKNHSSVQNMRQAIWAIFLHKLSTDEYPQHGFCPIGEDSWCGFKKAEASGKSYKHKNSLPVAVVEAMRPIFRDLSHPDLLKKFLHGKTQNPNESFHNVVWSRVPKATFVQNEILSLGVYDAVCSFNDGNVSKLKMLQKMGVEPGEFSVSAMKLLDRERLMKAIYAFSGRSKKIRKDKRRERKKEEDNIKKIRGKKELIERMVYEKELIASSYECPKCNEQMRLNERKSVVLDGFERRCRKKGVNTHDTRRVAGQVDRSECAIRNCWEQWTREGIHARKTGTGATGKTTRREDRRIVRQALEDLTVTRSTI